MKYVPKTLSRTVATSVLRAKQSSPTLLFVGGIVGVVGATVLACRATLKLENELDHVEKDLIEIETLRSHNGSTDKEYHNAKIWAYTQAATKITKLYAPAVVVGVISVGCLTKSHRQLMQRNASLTAAFVGLQNFLESYRGRVREEIGEERERNVYYAATPIELAEDTPDGPKKVFGSKPNGQSPYMAVFDDKSWLFQDQHEYNENVVRIQQQLATDKLQADGFLFLNDVYDRLDLPKTEAGQHCGWFIGSPQSDDFVEIRILPVHDMQGTLYLDFNVAGVVSHMLTGERRR